MNSPVNTEANPTLQVIVKPWINDDCLPLRRMMKIITREEDNNLQYCFYKNVTACVSVITWAFLIFFR